MSQDDKSDELVLALRAHAEQMQAEEVAPSVRAILAKAAGFMKMAADRIATPSAERTQEERQLCALADWCQKKFGVDTNSVIGKDGWPNTLVGCVIKAIEAAPSSASPFNSVLVPRELTAENGAKAALSGEFTFEPYLGHDGKTLVPWDMIKQIHRKVVELYGTPSAIRSTKETPMGGYQDTERKCLPITIRVNGDEHAIRDGVTISYEDVVKLAGHDPKRVLTVTYTTRRKGDEQRQGGMRPGCNPVLLEDGMLFDVGDTSNA